MKDNNCRLNNIVKDTEDFKLSLATYQDITDDKIKNIEISIEKMKENYKQKKSSYTQKIDEAKDKQAKLQWNPSI